ncbi:MAG: TIGR00296 family protein [Candidatus Hodarchaeales archaeon]
MNYSGEYLVKLARKTIEHYLKTNMKEKISVPSDAPRDLFDHSGVFVTLHKISKSNEHALRGCIGRIESPNGTLIQSTIDSAIDAAINDPRFPPVRLDEMNDIIVEVTILTVPEEIKVKNPEEYFNHIIIGKHGLIAQRSIYQRGLLLPQVPVEQQWDLETYLNYVCLKAGLPADSWKDLKTKIFRFEGLVFAEESPRGTIIQRVIS